MATTNTLQEISDLKQLLRTVLEEVLSLRSENAILKLETASLKAENAALKAENADLRERLSLNSTNSSKPPSSDGLSKPPLQPGLPKEKGNYLGGIRNLGFGSRETSIISRFQV